ncbi:MAG: hypothetical protein OXC02_11000 [Rhodobacteraceae bacterium]|nr:hypothetical protein [Paracoccaceae bacterium]
MTGISQERNVYSQDLGFARKNLTEGGDLLRDHLYQVRTAGAVKTEKVFTSPLY